MTGPATAGAARAFRYDAWSGSPWGRYAWRIETRAVTGARGPHGGRQVADIGCGTGRLLDILTSHGARALGTADDTAEVATWFGDDITFRGDSYRVDLAGLPMMGFALSHAGAGTPFLHRLRLAANLVLTGGRAVERGLMSHCLTTAQMAGRLGLASEVCDPLRQVFTRWDAKGVPEGVGGEEIAHPVRLFHLADTVEVFHRAGGVGAAVEVARARRGKHFDPEVVDLFCATAPDVLADMD